MISCIFSEVYPKSIFSFVHYKFQSLLNKIDKTELELSHFDVIALSETWLSPATKDDDVKLAKSQDPFRKKDRQTNNYGGVIVYVREYIPCKRRCDLELQGLESIWLELKLTSKVILFGLFYRPQNTNNEILENNWSVYRPSHGRWRLWHYHYWWLQY